MLKKSKSRQVVLTLFVAACLPVALADTGCCPDGTLPPCTTNGNGTPTQLLNMSSPWAPFQGNFTPSAAGRTITVTVAATGNTASRPIFDVVDALTLNPVVIDTLIPGSSSTQSTTFQSTGTSVLVVRVAEAVAAATQYTLTVTEL